jgi:hypothetical protein
MLKLNPKPTFDADIKLTVPGQDDAGTIKLTFKYMPKKALFDFFKKHQAEYDEKTGELIKDASTDDVMIGEIVTGWKGLDVEFNQENLSIFLDNYPAAAGEIIVAYNRLVLESRVKN